MNKNDYELIVEYKNAGEIRCNQIITHFCKKYKPLMHKYAHLYKNRLGRDKSIEYSDIISEYMLLIYKALNYTKPRKINNKEKFSFGVILKKFIRTYSKLMTVNVDRNIHDKLYSFIDYKCREDCTNEWIDLENKIDTVVTMLTPVQIDILNMLRKGYKNSEICKILKITSHNSVAYHKNRIRRALGTVL